jgi:hypothetical protein
MKNDILLNCPPAYHFTLGKIGFLSFEKFKLKNIIRNLYLSNVIIKIHLFSYCHHNVIIIIFKLKNSSILYTIFCIPVNVFKLDIELPFLFYDPSLGSYLKSTLDRYTSDE